MNSPTSTVVSFFKAGVALAALAFTQIAAAQSAVALDLRHPGVRAVMALQAEVTAGLMSTPAVLGTAVGIDNASQPVLVVFVDHENAGMAAAIRSVPPQMRNIATKIELTEKFRAFAAPPKGTTSEGVSHKTKQTGPIQLGTSGGWGEDLANGYCCGGTLGSLVKIGTQQYILSNYHVLEADIVPGGNKIVAGSSHPDVIHPGLIDVNCHVADAIVVAKLVKTSSLPDHNVDCAIAAVEPNMVRADGSILEIGTISSQTVAAAINQKVKKSGRTSGLSRSTIAGLNATVRVAYENECAGGAAFTVTFTGQIVAANRGSKFLIGGDSGSLMVEDVGDSTSVQRPRAVGLLFAGSSTSAIANPIDEVLSFLGATMVGTP